CDYRPGGIFRQTLEMCRARDQCAVAIGRCELFDECELARAERASSRKRPKNIEQKPVNMLMRNRRDDLCRAKQFAKLPFEGRDLGGHLSELLFDRLRRAGGAGSIEHQTGKIGIQPPEIIAFGSAACFGWTYRIPGPIEFAQITVDF